MAVTTNSEPGAAETPWRGIFFRHPRLAVFLLAWSVGVIDASTFERFGVFTSNQAGNLVIITTTLFSDPATAQLPALSLAGAGVGAVLGAWLGTRFDPDQGLRVVAPMTLATALLVASFGLDLLELNTALIPVISAGLACLASALLLLPVVGMWITANTGQFLTTVSGLLGPRKRGGFWRGLPPKTVNAATLISGFILGALFVGAHLMPTRAILPALVPAFVAIGLGYAAVFKRARASTHSHRAIPSGGDDRNPTQAAASPPEAAQPGSAFESGSPERGDEQGDMDS